MTPPKLSVVVTNNHSAILASATVRRGYELGELVGEVLFQLRAKSPSRIRIACRAIGDDPPELRLEPDAVADAAAAGAELHIVLESDWPTAPPTTQAAVVEAIIGITGSTLDPGEVTRVIGLAPTRTERRSRNCEGLPA